STYIAGIPELIQPGSCGWLVPAGSVEALIETIRAALSTPDEELERMGEIGAHRVAAMHNVSSSAKALRVLFQGGTVKSESVADRAIEGAAGPERRLDA